MKKTLSLGILTLMRVFLLFISIGLSTAYANYAIGQNKLDVALTETSVEEFFNEIQAKSDYIFFYKDDVVKTGKKITLNLKDVNISTVLDKAFLNTSLIYKIEGKQIVVKKTKKKIKVPEKDDKTAIQEKTITGTIYDVDGVPLVGVNILVKGTTRGTQTDFDGNYAIKAELGSVLEFSYIGMLTKSITVGDKDVIDVTLEENAATLNEVVIVGYGSQTKEALTGSVSVVKGVELEQAPTSTFEQSLRGGLAGLQGAASDGAPGSNTQIRIRGIGSINASSEPLYVIDGIPIQAGSQSTNDNGGTSSNVMSSINPNDIASISVLKDAASTAIYGSRGANGVILITTKQGQSGKATIELKTLTGFNSPSI